MSTFNFILVPNRDMHVPCHLYMFLLLMKQIRINESQANLVVTKLIWIMYNRKGKTLVRYIKTDKIIIWTFIQYFPCFETEVIFCVPVRAHTVTNKPDYSCSPVPVLVPVARSVVLISRLKNTVGWFVVREKHCSGWKNKLKKTDYKPGEQGRTGKSCYHLT
jgi:hypothetical protein